MLHRIRSWLGGWWHDQRGSQGIEAAGATLAAAAILGAVLLGAQDFIVPAVERAMECAAAVLQGGGLTCEGEADEAVPPTPEELAAQYVDMVAEILDRAARDNLTEVDVAAALRALPTLPPDAEVALWALLEQRYHAADPRALTDTDLYRQYQQYPQTTTLGHVVSAALAFERYVQNPLRYDGQVVQTHAQIWAEYAHNRALGDAVAEVYVAQLERLDALAAERPLTEAEVWAREDLLLRLNGPLDTDNPVAPSMRT